MKGSHAKLFLQAKDIKELGPLLADGPPRPIHGALVRTEDGARYCFHTDGSLRHAGGRIKGKAARKAHKRARRSR